MRSMLRARIVPSAWENVHARPIRFFLFISETEGASSVFSRRGTLDKVRRFEVENKMTLAFSRVRYV